jgi:hypothetical protein
MTPPTQELCKRTGDKYRPYCLKNRFQFQFPGCHVILQPQTHSFFFTVGRLAFLIFICSETIFGTWSKYFTTRCGLRFRQQQHYKDKYLPASFLFQNSNSICHVYVCTVLASVASFVGEAIASFGSSYIKKIMCKAALTIT